MQTNTTMTAESLKPFLSAPNALGTLPKECVERKTVKSCLIICGIVILFGLAVSVVGLEIWNINRITDLQREVDSLKQQMQELRQLRTIENLEDFNEFEEAYDSNEVHSSDEYEEGNFDESESDTEEGSTSVFGIPDGFPIDDMETEISVQSTSNTIDGKRKARSINGLTYQGVPILEESYMNRHHQQNRTRHQLHHFHQGEPHYQQMRQRPEETATPPPQLKLKWDDESNREIPSHHQLNTGTAASVAAGRHHRITIEARRHHNVHRPAFTTQSTIPLPSSSSSSYTTHRNDFSKSEKFPGNSKSNLIGPDYTTKPPGPTHDRRSRVMMTNNGENNKFQKVIKNPGTYMESRQPPMQKVGRLMRKSSAPARVTALHLAKYHPHYSTLRATNHVNWQWHPVDTVNQEALNSPVFKLSHDGVLTVNDTGLYFVYAQITYADQHSVSGFNILVNNRRHASCSIHGQQGKKTNTCYTAALVDLDHGSQLEIRDMDEGHVHLPFQEKTFFGLYKLGRRPTVLPGNT
ncbi:uncharacterized protein egr [Ochlerotatus camptorhynchus]|uniref:uncharacterized protein egr n=1 Tax=Ochlerotatus camptorhynchus TaxID=644619 RepID=UPI0031D06B24